MADFAPNRYPKRNPYLGKNTLSLIDPVQFDALIRDHGIRVLHEQATLCPCYYGRVDSGQKTPTCKKCENGYMTFNPREVFVAIFGTDLTKKYEQFGVWDLGQARMYSPRKFPNAKKPEKAEDLYVSYFDRITVLDFEEPYSEIVQRSNGKTDFLSFKALEVQFLRSEDVEYRPDIDFRLDEAGNIEWVSDNQPLYDVEREYGTAYTVWYLRNPIYRVVHIFEENRFVLSGVRSRFKEPRRLVQESLIKKDFLITKQDVRGADRGVQEG